MIDTQQLEDIVIAIRDKSYRSSACVIDEYFAENIEQKMQKLPSDSRDEFMRIAIDHGYKSPRERQLNFTPQADGFDEGFYDDLFLLSDDEWRH